MDTGKTGEAGDPVLRLVVKEQNPGSVLASSQCPEEGHVEARTPKLQNALSNLVLLNF